MIDKELIDDVYIIGKGLIILLHGEPGVGKSSTAGETNVFFPLQNITDEALKSASLHTLAVLYSRSHVVLLFFTKYPSSLTRKGDIGEYAEDVEARLENHFQLAHKWGCVLLLDEAE